MELIANYMKDDELRHKLNELTQKTFGFDFESWVTSGYFEGDYIPYSIVHDGKIISNVSANRMCFSQNGVERNYIQIGTVMTDEAYRCQGLARRLMEYVLEQYEGKCDGIYLFGDLGALAFYEKLGFSRGVQYRYRLKNAVSHAETMFRPVASEEKKAYMTAVRRSVVNSALEQTNKFGLQMFYTADMDNVFYTDDIKCFAVLEMEGTCLKIQSVICDHHVSLMDILQRIPMVYETLYLGFTPCKEDATLFTAELFDGGDDYRLFYRGSCLQSIETEKLYFPQLSHA